jgi:hypothetical protein
MQLYKSAVTSHCPNVDSIAATDVIARKLGTKIPITQFWGHPECSASQLHRFEQAHILPVNLGNNRYDIVGYQSATQGTLKLLDIKDDWLTPGEIKLIQILARDNETGASNRPYMSLSRLIKYLYEMPGYNTDNIIERITDVIDVYLTDVDDRATHEPRQRVDDDLVEAFPELNLALDGCQWEPFTLGRYIRDMWRQGINIETINESAAFWLNAWDEFEDSLLAAREKWHTVEKINFFINGAPACYIESDSRFLTTAGFHKQSAKHFVMINRRPKGHVAIMTARMDTASLASRLETIESGLWHHKPETGWLINGGPQYPDVEPTGLSSDKLIELTQKLL